MWAEGWRGHRWLLNLPSLWPVLTFSPVWSTQARLLHRNDCVRPSFPGSFIYGVPNFYVRSFLQGEENMVEKETENAVSTGSGSVRVAFGEQQWLGRGGPGPAQAQHTASTSRPDNSRRLLCCPLVTVWESNLPTAHPPPHTTPHKRSCPTPGDLLGELIPECSSDPPPPGFPLLLLSPAFPWAFGHCRE